MQFVFRYSGGICAYKNNDDLSRKIYIFQGSKRILVLAIEEWLIYSPYRCFSTNSKACDMISNERKEIENNELETDKLSQSDDSSSLFSIPF